MPLELELAVTSKVNYGWWCATLFVLAIEHLGHGPEEVYHGQKIVGLWGVLCGKGAVDCDLLHAAVLVEVAAIVGVREICLIILGHIAGADSGRVREYHALGGIQAGQ